MHVISSGYLFAGQDNRRRHPALCGACRRRAGGGGAGITQAEAEYPRHQAEERRADARTGPLPLRDGRDARAGARLARGDGEGPHRRHQEAADQGAGARPPLRVARGEERKIECDRLRQRSGDDRHRFGANEPRGRHVDRGQARGRKIKGRGDGQRRLLPLPRLGGGSRQARHQRHHPAGGIGARRRRVCQGGGSGDGDGDHWREGFSTLNYTNTLHLRNHPERSRGVTTGIRAFRH